MLRTKKSILSVVLVSSAFLACSSGSKSSSYKGIGRDSVDEKTLLEFAPPSLEPEQSRKIQNFLDIRSPGIGMLSPDRQQLYFSWRVTGTSQIWKINQPKSFPIQLTGGEDNTFLSGMTSDGKWLVLSRDRAGEENPGLYLQASSGGSLKLIQHKAKVQTFFQFATKDSRFIIYRANDVKPDSYAFYKYEIETGKVELIMAMEGSWSIADHLPDGRILFEKSLSNVASEFFEWNPESKELRPIIGQNEKEEYQVSYSGKENEFFVLTPKLGEFRRLYLWNMQELKPITPELKWDVSGFSIDRQKKHLLYSLNEGGYTRLRALDATTLNPLKLPPFPSADHVYAGPFSEDGQMVMIGVETSKGPRTSYSYDFSSGVLKQWVFPSQPEVRTDLFAKAELETYETRDGVKVPMFVRRSVKCLNKSMMNPCPVVVHFHGGPEAQSMAGFNVFAQMFVDEGFIFVEPNVRGSDGYGKQWLKADDGAKRLNVISDIEDAALYIKKNWQVGGRAPKVGVMGWSYGGYSTLYAMTKYAGTYEAGVALVGMSNLITFLNNTAPYRRALRIPEYGDPASDREALVKLSPSTYIDQLKNPLMIIQGANDPRVPVGEALQFHKALKEKKIESSLIIFADEGHGASKRSNKVLELGHAISFMKKHLAN
jgi:dipeptidyl aminopeptidase/acylaminoacyl peptidase